MIWDELTTLEIAKVDKKTPVILVMSATEQHGAHLPLATDRLIGEHFARSLNKSLPDKVLLLPSIAIGCSEHHMGFIGSLTVSHDTFINQVQNIISSVIKHGFNNIILLNSHGGNQAVGQVLIEKLGSTYKDLNIVLATWWKFGGKELASLNEGGPMSTGHACEFETSLIMLISPELVRIDKLEKGKFINNYKWAEGDMLNPPKVSIYRSMKQLTSNGVYGDPKFASKEKGLKITDLVLKGLKKIVNDLIS